MENIPGCAAPADFLAALRPLFDCLTDGICMADEQGRLLYANEAAGRLLGRAADEASERTICALLCGGLAGTRGETAAACPLKRPNDARDAVTFRGIYAPSGRDLRVRCRRVRLARLERHFLVIEDATAEARLGRRRDDPRAEDAP